MTKEELMKRIEELKIHPKYYSLGIEVKDLAYNIEQMPNGSYAVYYLERNEKCGIKYFDRVEDAYQNLYEGLKFNIDHNLDLSK
jgi:hypothetical protein